MQSKIMKKNGLCFHCDKQKAWSFLWDLKTWVLLLVFMTSYFNSWAQEQKISFSVENASLVSILDRIEETSGYSFVYKLVDLQNVTGLTIQAKEYTLRQVLDMCLKGTKLTYVIEQNVVIIRPQGDLPESMSVLGQVVSEQGEKIPGVTILVKGTFIGCTTDVQGRFELELPKRDDLVLQFSFTGMKTEEIKYSGQVFLRVILKSDIQKLDEVVVTGYQVIDKKKLTSAVTTVKASEVMIQGVTSIDRMLEGRIPDMMLMTNSGEVGVVPKIRIRGTSTLIGNREPLWVLDGIVLNDPVAVSPEELNDPDYINRIGNAIAGINPQDIDRIDVLKDASATALYGVKAANGVIVVTTKKGHIGKPVVRYNATGTYKRRPRYTDRKINVMNSMERVDFSRDLVDVHHVYPSNLSPVGYENLVRQLYAGQISSDIFAQEVQKLETMNTDWFDLLTEDVFSHSHTLSVSGGSEAFRYYTSVGYTRDNDVIKNNFLDRYTASINLDVRFSPRFSTTFNLNANTGKREYSQGSINPIDYAYNTSRCIPAYGDNGEYSFYKRLKEGKKYNYNILNELENSHNQQQNSSVTFSANLQMKITDWLNASAICSYTTSSTDMENYWGDKTYYVAQLRASEYGVEAPSGDESLSTCPFGGELNKNYTRNNNYAARLQLDMNKYFGYDNQHNIVVNLGYELSSAHYSGYTSCERGYYDERGKQFATGIQLDNFPEYKKWLAENSPIITDNLTNMIAGYASLSYSYYNYFTLNANARIDGSNKFGDSSNEKLLPVWSVSGSYNISEHMNENPYLSNLTLRLSYGYQGNMLDGQSPTMIIRKLPMNAYFNELTAEVNIYPNRNLKWEKTSSFNLGLDFALFNDAIQVSASYYYKNTKDAFMNKQVSTVNGRNDYVINSGNVTNSGYSFDVSLSPVSTNNFRWTLSASYSKTFNELKTLPGAEQYELNDFLTGNALVKGKAVNTFYSYRFIGLNPEDGGPLFDDMLENKEELENQSKYDVFTRVLTPSGKREPDIQGSLTNSFRYKSFRLGMVLSYSLGSKIRLFKLYEDKMNFSPEQNISKEFVDRWRKPGDENHTNIPGVMAAGIAANRNYNYHWSNGEEKIVTIADNSWEMFNYGEHRVVSGNYLKCTNLSLSYDVPNEVLKSYWVNNISLTFSVSNPFIICSPKLKGQTPIQSGFAQVQLSERPTFSLGVNVSF